MAGKGFVEVMQAKASRNRPSVTSLMKALIGTRTGHPCSQAASWHCRHRLASNRAWGSAYPWFTSSKVRARSAGAPCGILVLRAGLRGIRHPLFLRVDLVPPRQLLKIHLVRVEERAVHAGKFDLPGDRHAAAPAHAGAV